MRPWAAGRFRLSDPKHRRLTASFFKFSFQISFNLFEHLIEINNGKDDGKLINPKA
jgi:hypothetical protein